MLCAGWVAAPVALHGAKGEAFRFRPLHPLTTKREGRNPSFLDYPPRASDGAALLRSPLWGAAFLAFCWIGTANRLIGDDVLRNDLLFCI